MKLLQKIKGWFYREKHYPGGAVYKRILCFSHLSIPGNSNTTKNSAPPSDEPTWEGNDVSFRKSDRWKFELIIKGKNNKVTIGKLGRFGVRKLKIHVYGNNNTVTIGDNVCGMELIIRIGEPDYLDWPPHHAELSIGNNCNFVSTRIHQLHSHSRVIIGNDCLFSLGIQIRHTDAHPIYELGSRTPINLVKDLIIGDHVWVGQNVYIGKNARVASNCIIGSCAVVCKTYDTPNCAIAGNPAKIVRRNIEWESKQTKEFIENRHP